MGKYDDITHQRLRSELLRFAELIRKLDEEDALLRSSPAVLKMLGELRRMLFAWEIRGTRHLAATKAPPEGTGGEERDPRVEASLRVVREALQRERELLDGLEGPFLDRGSTEDR